jgi:hypothetical protein
VIPVLRVLPAVLATLILGAHFFRAGDLVFVAACLALVPVLFVPRPAVRAFCRICLAAGAVVWLFAAWRIARFRIAAGEPYLRMLAILGGVAAFTAFAAWALPRGRAKGAVPWSH